MRLITGNFENLAVSTDAMREMDRRTIEEYGVPGAVLMESAGSCVREVACLMAPSRGRVVVMAGAGNNAGDGFVAARQLANRGFSVCVVTAVEGGGYKGDAKRLSQDLDLHASGAPGVRMRCAATTAMPGRIVEEPEKSRRAPTAPTRRANGTSVAWLRRSSSRMRRGIDLLLSACHARKHLLVLRPPAGGLRRARDEPATSSAEPLGRAVVPARASPGVETASMLNFSIIERMGIEITQWGDNARTLLGGAEVIIDALLGTGLSGPLRPPYAEMVEAVNAAGADVLSVDIPSGLNGDTGEVATVAVRADRTVTFALPKTGLYRGEGPAVTGEIILGDIEMPRAVYPAGKVPD